MMIISLQVPDSDSSPNTQHQPLVWPFAETQNKEAKFVQIVFG
jgi:hypothetical protein